MTNDEISSNAQMTNVRCRLSGSFGFRHSFVIRASSFVISLAFVLSLRGDPVPSAKDILDSVRMVETQQHLDLDGQLRQNQIVVPFHLAQDGPLIRYSFSNPEEVLELRLGEKSSRLEHPDGIENFLGRRRRGTIDRQAERQKNDECRMSNNERMTK